MRHTSDTVPAHLNRIVLKLEITRLAECHDMSAMFACPRPQVDYEIGAFDRFLVVLDNDNRVTQIPQ